MPSLAERIAATLAIAHANRVYRRFRKSLTNLQQSQQSSLERALNVVRESEFGKAHGLHRVRSIDELRSAAPIQTYDDLRPTIERVAAGAKQALFSPNVDVLMFATSSGTTSQPKWIPVTRQFVDDYRRGWNTFGVKVLSDHPDAILRPILQITGKMDDERSASGLPVGAITGLLAQTQKSIVRRFYVGGPEIAELAEPALRHYSLMRLAVERDVAFAVTANPATLIELAKNANRNAESLIRDIRDGTLRSPATGNALPIRPRRPLRPNPARAAGLEDLLQQNEILRPRDFWNTSFLACWTGGSMGQYLGRLEEWYGPVPTRDIGLLASEGRVSLPVTDGTANGPLAVDSGVFEFIPVEDAEAETPRTLLPHELEVGQEAIVILTNTAGLVRYRLDDVIRVTGRLGATPEVEFCYRAGGVSSIAGEKLTEQQVVAAMAEVRRSLKLAEFDYVLAPAWGDPPFYRLYHELPEADGLRALVEDALSSQNDEYRSRRKSFRLKELEVVRVRNGTIAAADDRMIARRGATAEQYKRATLLLTPDADGELRNEIA